mgnify:CR=1 FL=1
MNKTKIKEMLEELMDEINSISSDIDDLLDNFDTLSDDELKERINDIIDLILNLRDYARDLQKLI